MGECVFGPIEKTHEFGFVLRVLQLLIVLRNIYNLLLSFANIAARLVASSIVSIVSIAYVHNQYANACGYCPQGSEMSWQLALTLLTALTLAGAVLDR